MSDHLEGVPKRVTVAIPIYNEQEIIPELLRRLKAVADQCPTYAFDFLFVDDGSRDLSLVQLSQAAQDDARISVLVFSRNFGHQAALSAALENAEGDAVVLMDGDLQDPPEVIPEFLKLFEQGNDVVFAVREKRKESLWLRVCYLAFYRLLARLSSHDIPTDAGDFSLMSRRTVDCIKRLPESHRFIRGLRAWVGFKQASVRVERAARFAGERKYTLRKLFGLAADAIFSFSVAPLRAITAIGAGAIALSTLFTVYAIVLKLAGASSPSGFSALLVTMVFLSGVQLLFLGVIGEYVGRVYEQTKARPAYILDRTIRQVE